MNSKQRVLTALAHRTPDVTPLWQGAPKQEVVDALCKHYGVSGYEAMLRAIGSDFRWIGGWRWTHPEGKGPFHHAGLTAAKCRTAAEVDALPWPDPKYIDVSHTRQACADAADCAVMGGSWAPFFHEIGWLIGQEEYFIKMHTDPAVVEALTEHIIDFHLAVNEAVFRAAGDLMDFYFFGNDLGTQLGPFISPECFRRFIRPGMKRLADHARRRGLHVWLHSCGSVRAFLGEYIDIGIEALHPVQVSAAGMSPEELGREFGDKLFFVGGIDVHRLLRTGTPDQVRQAVRHNKKHLGPAYAVSPSHEAVLPDVKLENLLAMFDEARRK